MNSSGLLDTVQTNELNFVTDNHDILRGENKCPYIRSLWYYLFSVCINTVSKLYVQNAKYDIV